ncbi:MAG: carbamoyltransferase HypF, partial [Bacillota bacterium]
GGDLSTRKPYRMALVYLYSALGERGLNWAERLLTDLSHQEMTLLTTRIGPGTREPLTSSCGRLFDAVGAALGVCGINRYEGQAAIELEACADPHETGSYGFSLEKQGDCWVMDLIPMWSELMNDIEKSCRLESMAMRFHLTLVRMFLSTLLNIRDETGLNRVVLSGGVFHNQILLMNLIEQLSSQGFMVYHHQKVPPGDGGISLGQAVIASEVSK